MHIEQTFDADAVDAVLRDPSVYPLIADDATPPPERLTIRPLLYVPENVCLLVRDEGAVAGAFVFVRQGDAVYEVHTNLLPGCRGRKGIEAAREAALWMFAHTPCLRIVTRVPADNPRARRQALACALRHEYRREASLTRGGRAVAQDFMAMSVQSWAWAHAPWLAEAGQAFHTQVERLRGGLSHDEDYAHDVMAGLAYRMAMMGAPGKGAALYNEWARVSGYQPIRHLASSPEGVHLMDIGDMVGTVDRAGVVQKINLEG